MSAMINALTSIQKRNEEAIEATCRQLTVSLRTFAASAGWPTNLVMVLKVVYQNDGFVPAYPKTAAREIEDLEYGFTGDPNPVLRRFLNRIESMAQLAYGRNFLRTSA